MAKTIQEYGSRKQKVDLDNLNPELDLDSKIKRILLAYLDTERLLVGLGTQQFHIKTRSFIDLLVFPFSSRNTPVGTEINYVTEKTSLSEKIMVAYGNALGLIYDDLMDRDMIEIMEGTQAHHYLEQLGIKIDSHNRTSFRNLSEDIQIKLVPYLIEQHSHAYRLAFGENLDFNQNENTKVIIPESIGLSEKEREEIKKIVEQSDKLNLSDFYSSFGSYPKEEINWVYDKISRNKHRWETIPHTSKDSLENLDDLLQASLGDKVVESKLKRVFLWYDPDIEVTYYEPDRVTNYDIPPSRNMSKTLISGGGSIYENTETAKILVRRMVKQITTELFQRESIRVHLKDVYSGNSEHYVDEIILQQALQLDGSSYQDTIRYLKSFKNLIKDVFDLSIPHGNPYNVLHIDSTKELTEETVNRAYSQRLRELHPDTNGGDGEEFKTQFEKIRGAKNILLKIIGEGKFSNNYHVSELRKYVGRPSYFVKDMRMGVSNE